MDFKPEFNMEGNITINGNSNNINCVILNISIDQRGNLKDKHNQEEYEFDMFCIEKAKNLKETEHNVRVLCTNIYSGYEFITDHAFIDFPKSMYDKTWNFSLIKVKGIVYKYKRYNQTEDYSFVVTQLLDMSNRIIGNLNNSFKVTGAVANIREYEFNDILKKFTTENLYDITYEQLLLLDTKLSTYSSINQGFISGLIMTRYFLNTQLQLLVNQKNALRKASREVLIDLIKLFSYVMYEVDKGDVFTWKQFLCSLNLVCNYLQGICYDFEGRTKQQRQTVFENIDDFRNKIGCNESAKLHKISKTFNGDTGYEYPGNEEYFENILMCRVIDYLIAKRYIKIENK